MNQRVRISWLAALALVHVPGAARAAPEVPRVAVLNAASDGPAGARAAALVRQALVAEEDLSPLAPGALSRALEHALPPESAVDRALAEARGQLDAANLALARFDHPEARRALRRAEGSLVLVAPDPRARELLTEVAFQSGVLHLREQNRGLTIDAFRLVHRLAPDRPALDPARYSPEVVSAFSAARKPAAGAARLLVSSTFDGVPVLLDAVAVGETPLELEVAPGVHYLMASARGHAADVRRIDVSARDELELVLDLRPLPTAEQALSLRRELAGAGGARNALRAAAREVSQLTGLDSVVVVTDGSTGPAASIYRRSSDRLSMGRPVDGDLPGLFGIMVPAPAPGSSELVTGLDGGESGEVRWYQERWVVFSIAGGTVAAIVLTAVIATAPLEPLSRVATIPEGVQ
jgi:hypothetical protein